MPRRLPRRRVSPRVQMPSVAHNAPTSGNDGQRPLSCVSEMMMVYTLDALCSCCKTRIQQAINLTPQFLEESFIFPKKRTTASSLPSECACRVLFASDVYRCSSTRGSLPSPEPLARSKTISPRAVSFWCDCLHLAVTPRG